MWEIIEIEGKRGKDIESRGVEMKGMYGCITK